MTRRRDGRVLFVHPFGNPHEETIPFGAVGLMNETAGPKLGLYAHELTAPLVRDALVVAMDLHWVHSLAPVREIARELRLVAPEVVLVLGGYTATVFADVLVAEGVADLVVRGDAEHSFPRLVTALRRAESYAEIPNLVSRRLVTPWTYQLSQADFDAIDYLSIDWFPSLLRQVHLAQARPKVTSDYPLIVTHKGCGSQRRGDPLCESCYGQPAAQQQLRRGCFVARSPSRVRQDLERLSADPSIRRVMLFYDVAGWGESAGEEIFSQPYDLHLHFEPSQFCSIELLERVAASFASLDLALYYADMAERIAAQDPQATEFLAAAQRLRCPVSIFASQASAPALEDLARERGCRLLPVEDELIDAPEPNIPAARAGDHYALHCDQSEQFVVLGLVRRVMAAYLDAVAADLGLIDGAEAQQVQRLLEEGRWQDVRLADNPIRRQLATGANPRRLAFEVAPFRLPEQEPLRPLGQVPKSWLLAPPSRLGPLCYRLGEPEPLVLAAEWTMVRSGNPDGVAVNVVSDQPGAMSGLRYDDLWKLCAPLYQRDFLRAGQRRSVEARFDYRLAAHLPVRFELSG